MEQKIADKNLVAFCGLYCGECKAYKKGKCPGCQKNEKATWCKIRTCCREKGICSCADCNDFTNACECKKFNNIFSKFFALVFKSDRQACIDKIKEIGYAAFAEEMTKRGAHTIKKK
jgi:hypothetical protein